MDRRRDLNMLRMTGRVCGILTWAKTLVLFEVVHRPEDDDVGLNSGEQAAGRHMALSAALERVFVEPFDPRYSKILRQAHERLFARGAADDTFE